MNRIKEVLEEKGIKQTWLAEKIGKSFSQTNESSPAQLGTTFRYHQKKLGVDVKELIDSDNKNRNNNGKNRSIY